MDDKQSDQPPSGSKDQQPDIWKACTGGGSARCWLWDELKAVNEILRPDYLGLQINDTGTGLFLFAHGMHLSGEEGANFGGMLADALLQRHSCIHKLFSTTTTLALWHLRGVQDLTAWGIRALNLVKAFETGKLLRRAKFILVESHDACMDQLADALRVHPNLRHLEFSYSEFAPKCLKGLLEAIAEMPRFESVKLQWSEAVDGNLELFQHFLRNCSSLKKLELKEFDIEDLKAILKFLDECTSLEELVLDSPGRWPSGKLVSAKLTPKPRRPDPIILPFIKLPSSLTTLDISIESGDGCLVGIAKHLASSNSLRDVSILAIEVGDIAALALAAYVKRSKCLRNLMFCAKVSREAFFAFADAVEANTDVKLSFGSSASVYIRDWLLQDHDPSVFSRFLFPWKPDTHEVLTALLRSGQHLSFVNLAADEYVSRSGIRRLFDALVENGRVEQVSVECLPSHDLTAYVDELVYLLRHRSSITRFYMAKALLMEQDCVDVLDALGRNTSLTEFHCGSLLATDRVIQALTGAVRRNYTLVKMKFAFGETLGIDETREIKSATLDSKNLLRLDVQCPMRHKDPGSMYYEFVRNVEEDTLAAHYVMGLTSSPEGAKAFREKAGSTALTHILSQWRSGREALTKKRIALALEKASSRWDGPSYED